MGLYQGADNKSATYTLAMGYDNMHRITSKKQQVTQSAIQFEGTLHAGYDLTYAYQKEDGHKFQLDNVRDMNYRTEETPTDSATINNGHKYEYDTNGNLVYINTSRVKRDGKEDEKAGEQKYKWDEENRLLAADENGFVSNYWYDADGERTVKSSGENEEIYVNSEFSGGRTNTAKFSLYVSPYLVASQGGRYTKHIYIGSQRIVSKLGDLASYGADPRRIPYAGNEADGITVDYKAKYVKQQQSIKDSYKDFGIAYNGEDNDDYVNGEGFCCNDGSLEVAHARLMAKTRVKADDNFHDKDAYEKMQFYYHPDHLGSSSYITNLDGEVAQHIEYVPFGEVFIEERNNTWNTPYLFNAKEFDEETGMYYYGARYYEPRLSLWMSTDPLEEKYCDINAYAYCHNNPVNMTDPEGLGDYYTNTGYWLGTDGKKNNLAYITDYVHVNKSGMVDKSTNSKLLPILNSNLLIDASTAYAESSGNVFETYAIASVHTRNRVAYGEGSPKANQFLHTPKEKRNEYLKMQQAIGAVINANTNGFDYSHGATMWDGQEQAFYSSDTKAFRSTLHTSKSNTKIQLHQNTMGWTISNDDYSQWKRNVGARFKAPQVNYTPDNGVKFNKYYEANVIRLKSTVVYGKTIFWKELKGRNIIRK